MVDVGNDELKVFVFIHTFALLWIKLNVVKFCEFNVLKLTNWLSIVAIGEDKGKLLNVFVFVHIFALFKIIGNVVNPWWVKV